MSLAALAARGPAAAPAQAPEAWFDGLAEAAVRRTSLVVEPPGAVPGQRLEARFAILEVEFYYDAPGHRDPFAHLWA